jgi:hypothetical protein
MPNVESRRVAAATKPPSAQAPPEPPLAERRIRNQRFISARLRLMELGLNRGGQPITTMCRRADAVLRDIDADPTSWVQKYLLPASCDLELAALAALIDKLPGDARIKAKQEESRRLKRAATLFT